MGIIFKTAFRFVAAIHPVREIPLATELEMEPSHASPPAIGWPGISDGADMELTKRRVMLLRNGCSLKTLK